MELTEARRNALTATLNLLARSVALALLLGASAAWAGHHPAVAFGAAGAAAAGQSASASPRQQADDLLARARQAMSNGDYQQAELYVQQAEQLNVHYDGLLQRFGDSPERVRRDLAQAAGGVSQGVQPPSQRFPLPRLGRSATAGRPGSNSRQRSAGGAGMGGLAAGAKTQACTYLDKGRAALATGDTTSALGWYHSALSTGAAFAPGEYSPQELAAELRGAGVDATRLVPASATGNPSPPLSPQDVASLGNPVPPLVAAAAQQGGSLAHTQVVANPYALASNPVVEQLSGSAAGAAASSPDRKAEVLRNLALAQAALNRGDLNSAEQYTRTADSLNLPDAQYGPEDLRPWMLWLEIGRQRRPQHAQPAGTSTTLTDLPAGQTPAQDVGSWPGPAQPASAETLPRELNTGPEPRMAQLIPAPAPATAEDGQQLFLRGEEALRNQDVDMARRLFQQAWSRQNELDDQTRQRLQDHLQLLRAPAPGVPRPFESSPQAELDDAQRELVQVLLNQASREHAAILQQRQTDPKGASARLRQLREQVAQSDVDPTARQQLLDQVDQHIVEMEQFIERNRARIEMDDRNKQVLEEVDRYRQHRMQIQQKLAEFVEQFNTLMDQQRYPEAAVVAKQARELDPLNPVVQNLVWKSEFARQFASSTARRERSQEGVLASFESVEESAIPFDDRIAINFPDAPVWSQLSDRRRKLLQDRSSRYTEAEQEIQKALKKPVDVDFENVPLTTVLDALSRMAGVNYYLDQEGMRVEGIEASDPVTIKLRKAVSLESALNLILQPKRLSYVIQDEVLRITSEQERSGDVYQQTYYVADLVLPIPNFVPSYNMGLAGAIHEAHLSQAAGLIGGRVNESPLAVLAGNETAGPSNKSVLAQMGASGMLPSSGSRTTRPVGPGPGGLGGGPQADFDSLIELITTTIEPDTWDEVGGEGSIAPFETNLSLVITQTQEVHEKIVDLLRQLRRLQDLQVTIEVRFITLTDNFFERIGVDFDFNIDDNTGLSATQVSQMDDSGPSVTVGFDPATNDFTTDLDLKFSQGSFGGATPFFGGYDAGSAANFGFAILSDIEAFFVIEAAQGDSRTNIMQAPKVTLFNGQSATVSDSSQRPFVTSVIPVVGDFAAAHQPVITVLSEGTTLNVQAVVSEDRRFVRLTLVPFFSKIGDVDTFTFQGTTSSNTGTAAVDPSDETKTVKNEAEAASEGTTVQLPTLAFTTVTTTVSVPDGGTILLGGIKRMAEGRTERGVPLMSKLPYINRLFRNVGIGREARSLMMMVTPRIIIQEEEEERLGVNLPTQ